MACVREQALHGAAAVKNCHRDEELANATACVDAGVR